jgi:hypothetical protein
MIASPAFTGTLNNGASAWNTTGNIASNVNALKLSDAQKMILTGTSYRLMPTLFADSHVEMVLGTIYQNVPPSATTDWIAWDPLPQSGQGTGSGN